MDAREQLVRWMFAEAWSRGATRQIPMRVGPITFHYGGAERHLTGEELAELIDGWRAGFPDLRFEVLDLVAREDRIATRCRLTGTHEGMWRGRPPTGRRMDVDVMMFFRFEGERLVEAWEVDDALRRERQLTED